MLAPTNHETRPITCWRKEGRGTIYGNPFLFTTITRGVWFATGRKTPPSCFHPFFSFFSLSLSPRSSLSVRFLRKDRGTFPPARVPSSMLYQFVSVTLTLSASLSIHSLFPPWSFPIATHYPTPLPSLSEPSSLLRSCFLCLFLCRSLRPIGGRETVGQSERAIARRWGWLSPVLRGAHQSTRSHGSASTVLVTLRD